MKLRLTIDTIFNLQHQVWFDTENQPWKVTNDVNVGLMASGRDETVVQQNSRYGSRLDERSVPSRMVWPLVHLDEPVTL